MFNKPIVFSADEANWKDDRIHKPGTCFVYWAGRGAIRGAYNIPAAAIDDVVARIKENPDEKGQTLLAGIKGAMYADEEGGLLRKVDEE